MLRNFAQVWRTSTVRLTATFIAIFGVFAILLIGFISWQSALQIQREQAKQIDSEIRQLLQIEASDGLRTLALAVNQISARPGPGLYFLGDVNGQYMLGNVTEMPPEVLQEPGVYNFDYERENPLDEMNGSPQRPKFTGVAIARSITLQSGLRLVVGRDVGQQRGFSAIILQSFFVGVVGIILFSIIAGGLTARRVLRRIDTIRDTSTKIMSGNLSERVPVTSRNDEFDGLATNLNAMMDRIEQLLQGLKEVTDNVAHDLKTPLTRLRSQAEAALRDNASEETREQALETVIAESDRLIRTFNALLMIARAEAGAPSGTLVETDISAIVEDMTELYAPVAEDSGIEVVANIEPGITINASRELIGQVMVNLLENAVKYAKPEDGSNGRIDVSLARQNGFVRIAVGDNGSGIPEQDRERVLERFVRLETSRSEPGSGLGLALVNAVARLHNGRFSIEDNVPGVRAVLELPTNS
ncbi:ATP-binding protein [Devosia sp. MC521]|uniref:sensor histidine kinase n=1 Tax=Devosia sp. MC521 TaxID=2759954 RepID=UPI0015FB0FF8|nr:ATP-binding protein [Devosia sp. MC521]MBJ6987325.1 HAMP domain-containing protein [Devosia sp. MC521]QMW63501.1 HAMP domain-containing protein [Devosia sp. MC521]